MAITIGSSIMDSGEATTFTVSYTVPAGDNKLLLVSVGLIPTNGQVVDSITYDGVNLAQVTAASCCDKAQSEMWCLTAPTEGTHDVVVTLSESAKAIINIVSLTGVHQTVPFHYVTSTAGDNVSIIPFTIEQEVGNYILGSGFCASLAYAYVLPGQTELWNDTYNAEVRTQALGATSTSAETLHIGNFLNEASTWALLLFNIKAAE